MQDLPKVFFDTNIFINYFYAVFKNTASKNREESENLKGRLLEDYNLIKKAQNLDFLIYWSIWGFWEFKQKINEQLYQNKCIQYGYIMPKEHYEAKKSVPPLDEEELKLFFGLLEEILNGIPIERRKNHKIEENEINNMFSQGCEFIDSILFFQAYKNDCDFFVTRDENFIKSVNDFCLIQKIKTQAIKPDKLLDRLKPNVCWKCKGKMENYNSSENIGISSDGSPLEQKVIYARKCDKCGFEIIDNEEIIDL